MKCAFPSFIFSWSWGRFLGWQESLVMGFPDVRKKYWVFLISHLTTGFTTLVLDFLIYNWMLWKRQYLRLLSFYILGVYDSFRTWLWILWVFEKLYLTKRSTSLIHSLSCLPKCINLCATILNIFTLRIACCRYYSSVMPSGENPCFCMRQRHWLAATVSCGLQVLP